MDQVIKENEKYLYNLIISSIHVDSEFSKQLWSIAGISNTTLTDGFLRQVNIEKAFTFHIGGLYEHKFNKAISFRPKLVLSFQGDIEKTKDSPFFIGHIDYKLTYLNAPLDFKFFSKPYIIVGPQILIMV